MGKKNCIVAQSGGPTVAINASLAGVVKGVKDSQVFDTIYGSVNGILGILNNNMINLSEIVANEEVKTHTVYVFRFLPLQTSYRGRIT